MAFENVQIQSTRNGVTSVVGFREDLAQGDVVTVSLTSMVGISTVTWRIIGRPEGSVAGGAGPEPLILGSSPSASFTVDSDVGGVLLDGTYMVEATINPGSTGEVRKTALLARLTGLTIPGLGGANLPLRMPGGFESLEDVELGNVRQGWKTQLIRLLRKAMLGGGGGGGGGGTVTSVNAGTGITVTGPATDPFINNAGVLDVTAGTNVTITGTAQHPTINAITSGGSGAAATMFRRPNIAGMVAIDASGFLTSDSHVCEVLTLGDFFKWVPSGALTADGITIVAATGGQWVRLNIPNQAWIAARFWSIDPVSGNDETGAPGANTAASDATPLKTMAELNRRLNGCTIRDTMTIHQLNDIPIALTTPLTNLKTADGDGVPYWFGKKTLLFSGAVTSYTAANPAGNAGVQLVVNSLSGTWSNSGTAGASLVGQIIESSDGTRAAIVLKDLGSKTARITQPNNSSGIGFSAGTTQVFTAGETIKVYSLPLLPCYPFGGDMQFPVVEYVRLTGGGVFNQFMPGQSEMTWSRCLFGGDAGGAGAGVVLISGNHSGDFLTCLFTSGLVELWGGTHLLSWCGVLSGGLNVENGVIAVETPVYLQTGSLSNTCGAIVFAGTSILGAFDCTSVPLATAEEGTLGRSIRFRGGDVTQPIFGTGNTAALVSVPAGTSATIPPVSVVTATTTAAKKILIVGVGYDLSDIPKTDLLNLASVNLGQ